MVRRRRDRVRLRARRRCPTRGAARSSACDHCANRICEAYFRTPRTTIKAFCDLLAVLEQNPGVDWRQILPSVEPVPDTNPDLAPLDEDTDGRPGDDDLASFRL